MIVPTAVGFTGQLKQEAVLLLLLLLLQGGTSAWAACQQHLCV
jgi:hypothetical protein